MKVSKYIKKQFLENYEKKTVEHWWGVYPSIINELKIKNKNILDVGCGNGSLTSAISKQGAKRVIGVDISKKWIKFCKKKYSSIKNLDFYRADASNLDKIKKNSQDYVLLNFVLLHITKEKKIQRIFEEINKVLKKKGEFILTEVHPEALIKNSPIRKTTKFSYKDGSTYKTKVRLIDGKWIEFSNVNWTLKKYNELLQKTGFKIQRTIEPKYTKKAQKIFKEIKTPQYIILHCKKLS
jgi:ubiquinone/menaquinone biosynthesis C-methylase UbiE